MYENVRYTIEGFSQMRAVELGLNVEDLVILRWFVDFWPSEKMVKYVYEGKTYGLVSYKGFLEQMPIIGGNKRTLARKMSKLVEAEVLENATIRQGGSYSVYKFGKNYDGLVRKEWGYAEKSTDPTLKNEQPGCSENDNQKLSILNTPSLNNSNTPPNPQMGEEKREPAPNEQKKKATASNSLGIDYEAFADTYNQTCKKLPSCKKMTDKRKKAIAKFLKEYTFEDWQKECELTAKSSFLCGASERGWRADFDWLLKIEKATKILEGGYQDNGNSTMFQGNKTSVRDYRERYEGDHGCEDEFDFGDE